MRASGGKCGYGWRDEGCCEPAIEHHFFVPMSPGEGTNDIYVCLEHNKWSRSFDHSNGFDETGDNSARHWPLLLATVGDELWCALECAFRVLAGDDTQSDATRVRNVEAA